MKTTRTAAAVAVMLVAALAAAPAFAWHHSRVRVGFFVGVPLVGLHYYYPPYYASYPPYYPSYYPPYYPPAVVVQQQPTVYIEQGGAPAAAPAPAANYWYYCAGSRAYYPYVKECAGGWQRVPPQPQPG